MKLTTFTARTATVLLGTALAFSINLQTQAQEDQGALSFEETMVVVNANAGDMEGLQESLQEISSDQAMALMGRIAAERSGTERVTILSNITTALTSNSAPGDLPGLANRIMNTVVGRSGGDVDVARETMRALMSSSANNPAVQELSDDDRTNTVSDVANNAAAGAVGAGEAAGMDEGPLTDVAGAVADGAYQAVGQVPTPVSDLEPVSNRMVNGGVSAAAEEHRSGVAQAMMAATARIQDDELRNRAVLGTVNGSGEAGGDDVAAAAQQTIPEGAQPPEPTTGDEAPGEQEPQPEPETPAGPEPEVPQEPVDPVQPQDASPI